MYSMTSKIIILDRLLLMHILPLIFGEAPGCTNVINLLTVVPLHAGN